MPKFVFSYHYPFRKKIHKEIISAPTERQAFIKFYTSSKLRSSEMGGSDKFTYIMMQKTLREVKVKRLRK